MGTIMSNKQHIQKLPKGTKAREFYEIYNRELGINFVKDFVHAGGIYKRKRGRMWINPEDPFDHRYVPEDEYASFFMDLTQEERLFYVTTNTLFPIEGSRSVLVDKDELDRLREGDLWLKVLDRLGIENWEMFDVALAEFEKDKKK
jgi:hypothetical protein